MKILCAFNVFGKLVTWVPVWNKKAEDMITKRWEREGYTVTVG